VIQNGGRLSAAFGAHRWRERSGGQISAQPAPLDSPESGHHPHLLDLDHRGAPGLQHRAFFRKSTVRQCNTAPGRRRERSGACARAAPMGQGVGRVWRPPAPRVERARPFSDEFFGVLGLTRARQSILARQRGRLARRRQEWSRAFPRCAPHTPSSISRMRARSRHTGVASMASIKGERSTRLTSWTAQAERQVRLQGDMNYRGTRATSSACAAGLIPTCSLIGLIGCGRPLVTTGGLAALAQPD